MTGHPKTLSIDGLVIDLDGVVSRGKRPIPGAAEAVQRFREEGVALVFATNNATATVPRRLERLRSVGLEVAPEELVTSAVVTAEELIKRGFAGRSAFLIGKDGIRTALSDAGIVLLGSDSGETAELVVVSGDDRFDYDAMRVASTAVRNGAFFVATNDDATFPNNDGLVPGAGAIVSSIVIASGRSPLVMGKPHRPMMEAAARRLDGCERIAVIGDQPATDLAGAVEMGWASILVLSGVTSRDAAGSVSPKPDLVVDTIADIGDHVRFSSHRSDSDGQA